jgi:hypothetical protein
MLPKKSVLRPPRQVLRLWLAAAAAPLLLASSATAQYWPCIPQRFPERPEPAKETQADEATLRSQGYIKLGRLATDVGHTKNTSRALSELLKVAAEKGGDVVRLEGAPTTGLDPAVKRRTHNPVMLPTLTISLAFEETVPLLWKNLL